MENEPRREDSERDERNSSERKQSLGSAALPLRTVQELEATSLAVSMETASRVGTVVEQLDDAGESVGEQEAMSVAHAATRRVAGRITLGA